MNEEGSTIWDFSKSPTFFNHIIKTSVIYTHLQK